ncbi:adhesive plaque matrix protein 2 [Nephila pilipes]|uniref:Adhesive plaque matrix protein 2 n=1 Tax=Nephila pilipes TaxID=299642 RepID=A0A8X6TJS9_NEPPI|nr:adhesive plaque matrix protein 2 [Nephila pilipes]
MECLCLPTFSGDNCEKEICIPNPCINGGMCKNNGEKFNCICPFPFHGDRCENVIETSTQISKTTPTLMTTMLTTISLKCDCGEKSSDCFVDTTGLKRCICLPGYAQIKEICSDCYCGIQSLSCHFNVTGDKVCICKPGYDQKSRTCVGVCESDNDCLNGGLCKRFERGSFCECRAHFTGDKCETSTACDELRDRCKAIGAVCKQQEGRGACECPPHKLYTLQTGFCEDICDTSKCLYGKCEIVGKSYRCRCDEGFSGSRCDEKIVPNTGINGFLILVIIICSIIIVVLIGILFHTCRSRRFKNKVAVQ